MLGLHHPARLIRDTAKYKPIRELLINKPRNMPSLKLLAHELLGVQIQQGEHDSVFDKFYFNSLEIVDKCLILQITDAKTALRIYHLHQNRWDQEIKSNAGRNRK